MKKLLLIVTLLNLLNFSESWAQPCLPDGIKFTSQEEIDNFQMNYPNCTEIEGTLQIYGYDISNLNGLSVVTSIVGSLLIGDWNYGNPNLKTLTGLDNLTSIGGNLVFTNNDSLISLSGLDNVTSIGGDLLLGQNDDLTSLTGLNNVTSIGGSLESISNDAMTNLAGLDNVTSIGGTLKIELNNAMTSLTGLEGLTSIEGNILIENNNSLTSLSGLDNVTSNGGDLEIEGNDNLTSLTGFESLTSIEGNLRIEWNESLTNLSGLDNVDAASIKGLTIRHNNSLSTCEISSVCDFLVNPNGIIYIYDNATGCLNQEEVEEACGVSVYENWSSLNPKTHPNPFSTSTTIEYELFQPEKVIITFYNQFGKQVDVIEDNQQKGLNKVVWSPENLADGIYYFRISAGSMKAGNQTTQGKLLIIK